MLPFEWKCHLCAKLMLTLIDTAAASNVVPARYTCMSSIVMASYFTRPVCEVPKTVQLL